MHIKRPALRMFALSESFLYYNKKTAENLSKSDSSTSQLYCYAGNSTKELRPTTLFLSVHRLVYLASGCCTAR